MIVEEKIKQLEQEVKQLKAIILALQPARLYTCVCDSCVKSRIDNSKCLMTALMAMKGALGSWDKFTIDNFKTVIEQAGLKGK